MTSNLIALWSLQQKEREAAEQMRHNKETEEAAKRRERIDETIARYNYEVGKFNAITNRYAAEKNASIALLNYNLGMLNKEVQEKRIASDERLAQMKIDQAERERVTNSYLTQRSQNIERSKNVATQSLNETKVEQDWKKWYTNTIIDFTKMIVGGMAINESQKKRRN